MKRVSYALGSTVALGLQLKGKCRLQMRWFFLSLACAAGLCLAATPAPASPLGYATDLGENLYVIDLGTGSLTLVGNHGRFLEALALSPTGQLFGTDEFGNLFQLDRTNASATFIGNTGRGNIEGLHFRGNQLIGVDFNDTPTFFSINTSNASTANIVTTAANTGVTRAMTLLDMDTALSVTDFPADKALRSTNLLTGATTFRGNIGGGALQVGGLDFADDGNLYGLDINGEVLLINPTNAATTVVTTTPGHVWLDLATFTPIPEPSTWTLLGLGALGLVGYAWRRARLARLVEGLGIPDGSVTEPGAAQP